MGSEMQAATNCKQVANESSSGNIAPTQTRQSKSASPDYQGLSKSHFHTQLAKRASQDSIAAPTSIDKLAESASLYLPKEEITKIRKAHEFAAAAHEGQSRRTGHPYITHPLAAASILVDMHLDHKCIIAALLHDVVEDTEATQSAVNRQFGREVGHLVEAVSKLGHRIYKSRDEAQSENLQKMIFAMCKDIRVVLVKMADRLHNMRTLAVLPTIKRRRIAQETLEIYAPLARRLGMYEIMAELEDLCFENMYPLRSACIRRARKKFASNRNSILKEIRDRLTKAIRNAGIEAKIVGRQKHLYSIYRKMKDRHKSFREIMDVYGLRIVVSSVDDCYRTLGVVHGEYKPLTDRFKDYVAIPKSNGYQSLHTALFGLDSVPIEVQIRTHEMDDIADHGIARHTKYNSNGNASPGQDLSERWLQEVLELREESKGNYDFVESLKSYLFPEEVYVFSPDGDIYTLPSGASPIDFAYAIHTDIGNTCVACRIDRALAPLNTRLNTGQTVNIITAHDAAPSPDWLNYVITNKARSGIRQALRANRRSAAIALGTKLLNQSLAHANTHIRNLDFRRLRKVVRGLGFRSVKDLLAAIGRGERTGYAVARRLLEHENPDYSAVPVEITEAVGISQRDHLIISFARCCFPVHGDPIVGHISHQRGFVVHRDSCPNLVEIRRRAADELTPAKWVGSPDKEFPAILKLEAANDPNALSDLAVAMRQVGASIKSLKVENDAEEHALVDMEVSVRGLAQLNRLVRRIAATPSIKEVRRAFR